MADNNLNSLLIDPINFQFNLLPFGIGKAINLPRACISGPFNPPNYDCSYGTFDNSALLGCYDSTGSAAQHQCYFTRQRSICMDDGDRYTRYQDLFKAPDAAELDDKYKEIVGDSYEFIDPTFKSLMQRVSSAQQDDDVAAAMEVCDASLFDSMDLDEVRAFLELTFDAPLTFHLLPRR